MISDKKNQTSQKKDVRLTAHELEILDMMMTNKNEKFMADQLHIPQVTVKTYIKSIYRKSGTNNFVSLIDWALDRGLVSPNF
jgi:DNA-binding NarL/FixJ family response regulator